MEKVLSLCFVRKAIAFVEKMKWELIVIAALGYKLVANMAWPGSTFPSYAIYYATNYSKLGWGNRMLIGSILDLFVDEITHFNIWAFVTISMLLFIMLWGCTCGLFIKNASSEQKGIAFFLVAAWLIMPTDVTYLFAGGYGRLELYLLCLLLLSVLLLFHDKFVWIIPFFCVLGMATHTAFLFLFAPFLCAILFREAIYEKKFGKYRVVLAVSIVALFFSAIYFQFFSSSFLSVSSLQEMVAVVQNYAGDIVTTGAEGLLGTIYFGSAYEQTLSFTITFYDRYLAWFVLGIPLTFPVWWSFSKFWLTAWQACDTKAQQLNVFVFASLPICVVPLFVLSVDLWRWIGCTCFVQMLTILYLMAKKDEVILIVLEKSKKWVIAHYQVVFVILLYCIAFEEGIVNDSYGFTILVRIWSVFKTIAKSLLGVLA